MRKYNIGDTVFTIHNRVPGILEGQVMIARKDELHLIFKRAISIEKDESVEDKLKKFEGQIMLTVKVNNAFPDLETLFTRLIRNNIEQL